MDDVLDRAAGRGFQLDEKPLNGLWVWAWHRGDDWRHPCFRTERKALRYMEDRLKRIAIFELARLLAWHSSKVVELSANERDLLLAALFELRLTRSAFDHDPEAKRIPFARISYDAIMALVAKLGGEPDTALFGAYRDQFADDVPVPEYPADETDEG